MSIRNYKKPNTISYDSKMYSIVYKIFKFLDDKAEICRIIASNASNVSDIGTGLVDYSGVNIIGKMSLIYGIIKPVVDMKRIRPNENRQEFITGKILEYLQLESGAMTRFLDIGGGNGNILSGLQARLGGPGDNYICVENKNDWQENYKYSNMNIRYLFWDNHDLSGVADASVNIIFCMVSLHHMTDMTISRAISEIKRVLAVGGRLMIKEHNATTENLQYIYWEHHLYHLFDVAVGAEVGEDAPEWKDYCALTVNNFKSAANWQDLITGAGFRHMARLNRFLDGPFLADTRNPSELYWDEFRV